MKINKRLLELTRLLREKQGDFQPSVCSLRFFSMVLLNAVPPFVIHRVNLFIAHIFSDVPRERKMFPDKRSVRGISFRLVRFQKALHMYRAYHIRFYDLLLLLRVERSVCTQYDAPVCDSFLYFIENSVSMLTPKNNAS